MEILSITDPIKRAHKHTATIKYVHTWEGQGQPEVKSVWPFRRQKDLQGKLGCDHDARVRARHADFAGVHW